ncbi:MAG: formate--tetrahydrofolate ligase [Gammaproteobacteria bacterium]
MKTNIEIAQAAKLRPITALAQDRLGIPEEALEPFGRHKAKLSLGYIDSLRDRPDGIPAKSRDFRMWRNNQSRLRVN